MAQRSTSGSGGAGRPGRDPGAGPEAVAAALGAARSGFRKALERRADFNLQRYGENAVGYGLENDRGSGPEAEPSPAPDLAPVAAGPPWGGVDLAAQAAAMHWSWDLIRPQLERQALNRSGLTVTIRPGRQPLDPVPAGHRNLEPGGWAVPDGCSRRSTS